jgi:ankyrin repeat protein
MRGILRVNTIGALALMGLLLAAPDAPVADAAMRGDAEAVRTLIRSGADVNAAHGDGMTALHWAAMEGHEDIAELVLRAGALVDPLTRLGSYTPLHLAAQESNADVVSLLLEAGADADARTTTGGATALHFAAASGSVPTIQSLLAHRADPDAAERQWGHTPLVFAAARNRAAAITALIAGGADPAITGTTLDMVQRAFDDQKSEMERSQRLAAQQAGDPSKNPLVALAPMSTRYGGAAPQRIAPIVDGVPQTLTQDAQIGAYGGLTALHIAARDGKMEAALALLEGGADVNQKSAGDHTAPLLIASINGQFDLAKMLLERGADVNAMADNGEGPLFAVLNAYWTPKSRHPEPADYMRQTTTYMELVEALLKAGADPNARLTYNVWHIELGSGYLALDWTGATPFFRAANALDVDAMKLLVRHGADPNIGTIKLAGGGGRRGGGAAGPDPSGLPPVPAGGVALMPIHVATGNGYGDQFVANVHRFAADGWLPTVKYLVEELGADVNARDANGTTPLHNAAARGDNEVIRYLVSKGADVMAVDRRGRTTVDMANGPQQRVQPLPETIKLLEEMGAKNNHRCMSC